MYKKYNLSSGHYASTWVLPDDANFYDLETVNELAIKYSKLPFCPEKEELSLTLLKNFHGYIIKYLNMIISGQCPSLKVSTGKEASLFLKRFLSKNSIISYPSLSGICKTLHLGFKGLTTDEIYDVLVLCFLSACQKYDPNYTNKVKKVCELLDDKFVGKTFSIKELNEFLDFNSLGPIKLLVRKEYLTKTYDSKKKITTYRRRINWPPESSFFESGPIGFVYFVQTWFRYYLSEYITKSMDELETQEGVLQLDYRVSPSSLSNGKDNAISSIPDINGAYIDSYGSSWAADVSLMGRQFDLSQMNDDWVRETKDKFFKNLSRSERWLLQMVFVKEFSWVQIANMLGCDIQTARKSFTSIIFYLKNHISIS